MSQRIAYTGTVHIIEWYHDDRGCSQALDYFQKQPVQLKRKLLNLFRLIGDHGKIFDETKFSDGIYAFKPQPDRYLCFFCTGKRIIVTNAFMKKSQKLPKNEKEKALKAYKNYSSMAKDGSYYEEKK